MELSEKEANKMLKKEQKLAQSALALSAAGSEKNSSLPKESSTKDKKKNEKKLARSSSVLSEVSTKRTSSKKGKEGKATQE
jgi:hypothetical protein